MCARPGSKLLDSSTNSCMLIWILTIDYSNNCFFGDAWSLGPDGDAKSADQVQPPGEPPTHPMMKSCNKAPKFICPIDTNLFLYSQSVPASKQQRWYWVLMKLHGTIRPAQCARPWLPGSPGVHSQPTNRWQLVYWAITKSCGTTCLAWCNSPMWSISSGLSWLLVLMLEMVRGCLF